MLTPITTLRIWSVGQRVMVAGGRRFHTAKPQTRFAHNSRHAVGYARFVHHNAGRGFICTNGLFKNQHIIPSRSCLQNLPPVQCMPAEAAKRVRSPNGHGSEHVHWGSSMWIRRTQPRRQQNLPWKGQKDCRRRCSRREDTCQSQVYPSHANLWPRRVPIREDHPFRSKYWVPNFRILPKPTAI
jgi:hypothetical protein